MTIGVFLLTAEHLSPFWQEQKLLLEGFLASLTQAHKHPHHDGAVFPSSGMVLLVKLTPPPGASAEGVG